MFRHQSSSTPSTNIYNIDHIILLHSFSATNARENRNRVPSATSVRVCNACPSVRNAAKSNACWRRAIVLSVIRVCSLPASAWSVPFVTSVKPGFVTAANVCNRTHAVAHCRMPFVSNANALCMNTVVAYSIVHSALDSYAKMTNLNIKRRARCWNRKTTNANRAIVTVNIRVYAARHAIAMIMSNVKASSMRKMHRYRARNAIMKPHRPRIWACQRDRINSVVRLWTTTMTTTIEVVDDGETMRTTHDWPLFTVAHQTASFRYLTFYSIGNYCYQYALSHVVCR